MFGCWFRKSLLLKLALTAQCEKVMFRTGWNFSKSNYFSRERRKENKTAAPKSGAAVLPLKEYERRD